MEQNQIQNQIFKFDLEANNKNIIKVFGVGGGGSNAVNYMYKSGIQGVDFVVCNTDLQALDRSPIPTKVRLGPGLTSGLGAGGDPHVGEEAALESQIGIEEALGDDTKMVFVTAGMGGGTGTGAAPIIAKIAKEKEILTVGIVTMPFTFEGAVRNKQATEGIEKLRKNVDSFIVINNNKLREVYGELGYKSGFSKADEVLLTAAKGIADVVTYHYTQNIDFKDVKTVLKNSGTAIMGSATADGPHRAEQVVEMALRSPLLENNTIKGAKNVLLLIVSSTDDESELKMDEIGKIVDYIHNHAECIVNIILGVGELETLESGAISVTVIATGFEDIERTSQPENIATVANELRSKTETEMLIDSKPAQVKEEESEPIIPMDESITKEDESEEEMQAVKYEQEVNDFDVIVVKEVDEDTEMVESDFEKSLPNLKKEESHADGQCQQTLTLGIDTQEDNPLTSSDINDSDVNFSTRAVEKELVELAQEDAVDPINCTIEEMKRLNSKNRQRQMNNFNIKYQSSIDIDRIEREPAYRRHGVNIDVEKAAEKRLKSSTSIASDQNGEVQIRTNNSFLHDNVD